MIEPDMSALDSAASTPAPESSGGAPQTSEASSSQSNNQGSPEALFELDKATKFKWEGKEWTPKDLKDSVLMQSDYSRKTQEIAQERKFYDNLAADLDNVRSNPQLANKFKEIYPEKFHSYLKYLSQNTPGQANANASADSALRSEFEQLKSLITEDKVAAHEKTLEAWDAKMTQKYPLADISAVYAKAQSDKSFKVTEDSWEQLWKADNDRQQKRYDTYSKTQVEKQKEANRRAKEAGPGGGIPGQAPQRIRLKDVADQMLSSKA